MTYTLRIRMIILLLRLSGGVLVTAFLAVLLPVEWMAATHDWLGLGDFPRLPIVDYLTRSIAALYGFHGVLVLLVSTDLVRYRPLVWYLAAMNVTFGLMMLAIDLHAGMPLFWTLAEGPPIAAMGVGLAALNRAGIPSSRNAPTWTNGPSLSDPRRRAIDRPSAG